MTRTRKLVFYSDTQACGNALVVERLLRLIDRPRPRIAYIAATPDPLRVYFDAQRERYRAMGADLALYLDAQTPHERHLEERLLACDAIHLSGGNTFEFLHWIKHSPLLRILPEYVAAGGVLIGVSAGAMLMTPDVSSARLCGDARNGQAADDTALGLVDFHFWPHYEPGRALSPHQQRLIGKLPELYRCPDGSAILVDGTRIEFFGDVSHASIT